MEKGRILILGETKENSYEIRNLLDNRCYELEIALSKDIGRTILSSRLMDLLVVHTEAIDDEIPDFFEFLSDRGISIPVMVLGEEASTFAGRLAERIEPACTVRPFDKPYAVEEMLGYIKSL
jgi:hypothetical protein